MALHALGDVRANDRTTAEIVDDLLQKGEVPFRTGHHFALKLTDFGRGKGLKLQEIPFAEVARIYQEQAKAKMPLSEQEFREVISAEYMVFGRKGVGGPQVAEVKKVITNGNSNLNTSQHLLVEHQNHINDSTTTLASKFTVLE